MSLWSDALAENPLIAILRGLDPAKSVDVAGTLVEAGFRIIEVPLNSPDPLVSIERIAHAFGDRIIVGAGTVLTPNDVTRVVNAGGRIIVAPNLDPGVGARSLQLGAKWCPGVMTPTESFTALDLGASILKFFPAELVPPNAIAAMRAVLPRDAIVAAVGGVTPDTMGAYWDGGANSFGLGSALFKPGYELDEIGRRATDFVTAYKSLGAQ